MAEASLRVSNVLSWISANCDRETWWRIAAGVHEALGPDGFAVFDDWSKGGTTYDLSACRSTYMSFVVRGGDGINFNTVVWHAQQQGYDAQGDYKPPSPEQKAANDAKAVEAAKKWAIERQARADKARERGEKMWKEGLPATADYPYLRIKGIQPHGARVGKWEKRFQDGSGKWQSRIIENVLLLKIVDRNGMMHGVQGITVEGEKMHLPGVAKVGHFILIKGEPGVPGLDLSEGFATGASIREAMGVTTLACMDDGNIMHVAKDIHAAGKAYETTIGADNDTDTEGEGKGNPGMQVAFEAGRMFGMKVAIPPPGCDFNDLMQQQGKEAIVAAFEAALVPTAAYAPPKPPAVPQRDAEAAGEPQAVPATLVPVLEEYPCWRVFDEPVFHDGRRFYGVNFFGLKAAKSKEGEPKPFSMYVCGPLHVEAQTHAFDELNSFGRLLRWRTSAGKWQKWAMPAELLAGDAKELRARLMSHGLEINPDAHHDLKRYLSGEAMHLKSMHCVLQTGWTSDAHDAFVLPGEVLGPRASQAVLQVEHPEEDPYERHGTAAGWRGRVAAMAPGNSALTLGILIALAGPLLDVVRAEPGGVHLWGDSSTGKSTVLEAASSVWGHHKRFSRSWRTTANGLEGAASHRTDTLLALDEIGQCDPAHLSDIVYMLGNGVGKQRANISGGARAVKTFRVAVLSTGEVSVAAALAKNGSMPRAGQGVRLIDVCVVGRAHGVWEALHQHPNGAAFSEALKSSVVEHYGHAGPEFVERVATADRAVLRERFEKMKEALALAAVGTQERRVASRLAVYALAGELATEFGITGWLSGWATEAVNAEFLRYRSDRGSKGHGNAEPHQILQAVVDFAQKHGDSRFESAIGGGSDRPVNNRAGWRKEVDGHVKYLFTSAGLKEATSGFDLARVLAVLTEFEALEVQESRLKEGKKSSTVRINGETQTVYCVNHAALLSALTPVAA